MFGSVVEHTGHHPYQITRTDGGFHNASSSAIMVDPALVEVLTGMGFKPAAAARALRSLNNNLEAAIELLCVHEDGGPDVPAPAVAAAPAQFASPGRPGQPVGQNQQPGGAPISGPANGLPSDPRELAAALGALPGFGELLSARGAGAGENQQTQMIHELHQQLNRFRQQLHQENGEVNPEAAAAAAAAQMTARLQASSNTNALELARARAHAVLASHLASDSSDDDDDDAPSLGSMLGGTPSLRSPSSMSCLLYTSPSPRDRG